MFCEQLIIKIYFPMFLFGLQLKNAYAVAKLRKTGYSKQKFYKEAFDLYKEVCSIPPPPRVNMATFHFSSPLNCHNRRINFSQSMLPINGK